MNDKQLNFAMLIFFASILGNGALIMLSITPGGAWITDASGGDSLASTDLTHESLSGFDVENSEGFISNTSQSQDDASFNPFMVIGSFFGAVTKAVLPGINALNFIITGLFAMELIFLRMSGWFPLFAPILLGISALMLVVKFMVIGYFGSVLLKSVLGGK